jgi:hypothetical protein
MIAGFSNIGHGWDLADSIPHRLKAPRGIHHERSSTAPAAGSAQFSWRANKGPTSTQVDYDKLNHQLERWIAGYRGEDENDLSPVDHPLSNK